MRGLIADLRHAFRSQRSKPGFTAVAAATLALGIGANTAIFSVADAVLLRPLPFRDPDRLLVLLERNGSRIIPVSHPNFVDWRAQASVFENMAAFRPGNVIYAGIAAAERLPARRVSFSYFATLGLRPAMGRDFLPEDDRPGAAPVAIASHEFWVSRMNGDAAAIGRPIHLDSTPFTLIGVLPPAGINLMGRADVYLPLAPQAHGEPRFNHSAITVLARMKPGVGIAGARAVLDTVARRLEQQHPSDNKDYGIFSAPLRQFVSGDSRKLVLIFLGAVAFVLLIACVNVANLLLARSTERARELAVRVALGASRARVVRQLVSESVLLGLEAGVAGLAVAFAARGSLAAFVPDELAAGVRIDGRVWAFGFALSVITGLLFGLAPALAASRPNLVEALKDGAKASRGGGSAFRSALVVAEVALAVVLCAGAGLMVRSIAHLLNVDPGFRAGNVLTMRVALNEQKLMREAAPDGQFTLEKLDRYLTPRHRDLLAQLQAVPGVTHIATGFPLPLSGETCSMPVVPEGVPEDGELPTPFYHVVSPDYFRAMGMPFLKGRTFTLRDDLGAPRAAIVSETFARRVWPDRDPIGKRFRFKYVEPAWFTVVGVVGDVRQLGLHAEAPPQLYMPFTQWPQSIAIVARTHVPPAAMTAALRRTVSEWDPELAVYDVKTMDQRLAGSIAYRRGVMWLLAVFGGFAVALTVFGIYSVMSYLVAQRTREIGIRMAIGATAGEVLRTVLGKTCVLAAAGVVIGAAGALALTPVLAHLIYGVKPGDPFTLAAAAAAVAGAAIVASYLPARRAATVSPTVALRCE